MTTVREPELTDELLSAYIDNAVTPAERQFVDRAVAADPAVAWQLESLQMTVRLLHELPALALPRSFLLTPEQIGEQTAGPIAAEPAPGAQPIGKPAGAPAPRIVRPPAQPGFWAQLGGRWRDFWQGGSPALRNAMATSLVLLFVLVAGPRLMTAPLGTVADAPAQAPVVEPAAGNGTVGAAAPAPIATATVVTQAESDSAPEMNDAAGGEAVAMQEAPAMQDAPAMPAAQPKAGAAETQPTTEEAAAPRALSVGAEAALAEEMAEETAARETQAMATDVAAPVIVARAMPAQDTLGVMGAGAASTDASPQSADPLAEAQRLTPPDTMPAAAAFAAPAGAAALDGAGMADPAAAAMPPPAPAVAPLAATSAQVEAPATTPTVSLTATPTATPTVAPVSSADAARVAGNQPALAVPTMPGALATAPLVTAPLSWLGFAQIAAAAGFFLFGLLWWRSRRS